MPTATYTALAPTRGLSFPTSPPPEGTREIHLLHDNRTRRVDAMVVFYVPGGEFQMGTTDDQRRYAQAMCSETDLEVFGTVQLCHQAIVADERPAHRVTLDGFWIDRHEVTNRQYRLCVEAGACLPPAQVGSSTRSTYYGDSVYDDYPVMWVLWQQATDYCSWVGGRLPTEAEWEYAARGPESHIFPWGDVFDGTRLNYCDVNCTNGLGDKTYNDGCADTAPVGSYPTGTSWCDAQDMAGNVREWVADWYGHYHGWQVNPRGPYSGELRVSRGGSWFDPPANVRSAKRGQNTIDFAAYKLGFRCAMD